MLRTRWIKVLRDLSSNKTRTILVMRYGLDGKKSRTLEECGRPYMITRERVRGIQAKGILQLKKKIQFKAKMAQINQNFD